MDLIDAVGSDRWRNKWVANQVVTAPADNPPAM